MASNAHNGGRLFIAVELPDDLKSALERVRDESHELRRELRWARSDGLHITLRFLGETTQEQRAALIEGLDALPPRPPFHLECRGLGLFGSPARPRVLWAGLLGDLGPLGERQREVEAMCASLGWRAENRAYNPHVTLARGRGESLQARSALESLLARHRDTLFSSFEVSGITLYSSQLGRGGSVYTPVHRRQLT